MEISSVEKALNMSKAFVQSNSDNYINSEPDRLIDEGRRLPTSDHPKPEPPSQAQAEFKLDTQNFNGTLSSSVHSFSIMEYMAREIAYNRDLDKGHRFTLGTGNKYEYRVIEKNVTENTGSYTSNFHPGRIPNPVKHEINIPKEDKYKYWDIVAYIVEPTKGIVADHFLLLFRGTASKKMVGMDLDAKAVGFNAAWLEGYLKWLGHILKNLHELHPKKKIIVCGHSLGGALSQHAICYWPLYIDQAITFNSPAINKSSINYTLSNNRSGAGFRNSIHFIMRGDIVSKIGEGLTPGSVYIPTEVEGIDLKYIQSAFEKIGKELSIDPYSEQNLIPIFANADYVENVFGPSVSIKRRVIKKVEANEILKTKPKSIFQLKWLLMLGHLVNFFHTKKMVKSTTKWEQVRVFNNSAITFHADPYIEEQRREFGIVIRKIVDLDSLSEVNLGDVNEIIKDIPWEKITRLAVDPRSK